ncbi:MAG TPA: hypothetical protein VIX14_02145 [Terriglobales bacterium]
MDVFSYEIRISFNLPNYVYVKVAGANQQCYLVPNSGPGNFGSFQEGLPRALQFSARFTF